MLKVFTAVLLSAVMVVPAVASSREERKAKKMAKAGELLTQGIDALQTKNDPASAVKLITQALEVGALEGPNLGIAYQVRGVAYSQLEQCPNAIPDFTQALAITQEAQTYGQRALCYDKTKQTQLAIADLKTAIPLDPPNPVYTGMLCQITFNAKIYAESAPACESYVVKYAKKEAELIQAAAQSYELIKNKKKAKEMWQLLLTVDPGNAAAKDGVKRTS